MLPRIVSRFPADWKCTVLVHRSGRDAKGNPLPETTHEVTECLVGGRATTDPVDRADIPSDTVILYADDPAADIREGDLITVPAGPRPSGKFRVDGSPVPWPLGLEVQMKKGA